MTCTARGEKRTVYQRSAQSEIGPDSHGKCPWRQRGGVHGRRLQQRYLEIHKPFAMLFQCDNPHNESAVVFPNPVTAGQSITLSGNKPLAVILCDAMGREIPGQSPLSVSSGSFNIPTDTNPGLYFLRIYSHQGIQSHRLVVE